MRTLHDQIREHLQLLAEQYVLNIGSMETKTLAGATLHQAPHMPEIMITLKIYGHKPRDGMTTALLERASDEEGRHRISSVRGGSDDAD